MNRHEVHVFENGTASIRDQEAGETMHSQVGPETEARMVYIEQSGLADRLETGTGALVLYDVGMGIASNALAALECAQALKSPRPLHIVSFENTLEGLRLSLEDSAHFQMQARHREKLEALIKTGEWKSPDGSILWELRLGDFEQQELSLAPEVIFYDFYSPKATPGLWTLGSFERLFRACEKRKQAGLPSVLTTYSAATFVRSALLLAGFQVGYGAPTALKSETTVAATGLKDLRLPLGRAWLERLSRSAKPFPIDVAASEHEAAFAKIRSSGQFTHP